MTSKKDQEQYWADHSKPYVFLPVSKIAEAFRDSKYGHSLESSLSVPYDRSKTHPSALPKTTFAVSKWELFRACFTRELLLIGRHRFLYIFKTCQVRTIFLIYEYCSKLTQRVIFKGKNLQHESCCRHCRICW